MSLPRPTDLLRPTVQFPHIIVDPKILKSPAYQQYEDEIKATFEKIKVGGKGLNHKVIHGINVHPRLNEVRVDGKVRLFYITYTAPNGENCCVITKLMIDHNHSVFIKKYKSFLKAMKLTDKLERWVHSKHMQEVVDQYFADLETKKLEKTSQEKQEKTERTSSKFGKDHTLIYFPAEIYNGKWIVLNPEQREFLDYVKKRKPKRAVFMGPQGCGKTMLAAYIMAQDGSDAAEEGLDELEEQAEPDVIYLCLKEGLLEQKKLEWENFPLSKKVLLGKIAHRTYLQQLKIDYPDRVFVGADHCKNWLRNYIDSQKTRENLPDKFNTDIINTERIIEMIYADFRILSCPENLEEDNGQKSRLNFQGEMAWTCEALEKYRESLKGKKPGEERWNADFTRLKKRPGVKYLGDEVTDWSDDHVYGICQQDTAYLFMDPNQRTGFGHASLESIKTTCKSLKVNLPAIKELSISYRNPLAVIAATVFFMQLRSYLDGGMTTGGQKNHILGIFDEAKSDTIKWLKTGHEYLKQLKELAPSHHIAIVTWDKEKAKKIFDNVPLIFTPDEDIKGMEFDYVVGFELCNNLLFASLLKQINQFLIDNNVTLQDIIKAGENTHGTKQDDVQINPVLSALITALGRTRKIFSFYETPKTIQKYRILFELIQKVTGYDIVSPEQCFQGAEAMRLEDWEKTAESFILQGSDQHAKDIFEGVLKKKDKFSQFKGDFLAYKNSVIEAAKSQSIAEKQGDSFVNATLSVNDKTEKLTPPVKETTNQKPNNNNRRKPKTRQDKEKEFQDKEKEFIDKLTEENSFLKVFYKGKNEKCYYDNLNETDKKIFLESCLKKEVNDQFYSLRLFNKNQTFEVPAAEFKQMKASFSKFISDLMKYRPDHLMDLCDCSVENGHSLLLNELLCNKHFKEKLTEDCKGAILWATDLGHANIVKVLLNHGTNPEELYDDKRTVLFTAMRDNNFEIVEVLLTHPTRRVNPSFYIYDNEKQLSLPFHCAVKLKRPKLIKLFLDLKTITNKILDSWIVDSLEKGNVDDAILILDWLRKDRHINLESEKYEDIEKQIQKRYLPELLCAVERKEIAVVKALLKHKTDINTVIDGNSALSIAMRYNDFEMSNILFEHTSTPINPDLIIMDANKQPISQFHYAIKLKQPKIINLFLEKNKSINAKTLNDGLVLAAETGNIANIMFIYERLQKDKCLNIGSGIIALTKAIENGHMLAVENLIGRIIPVAETIFTKAEMTKLVFYNLLFTLAKHGHAKVIQFLLEKNMDPALLKQENLFTMAVQHQKIEVVKILLNKAEQDPNVVRKFFDIAKKYGNFEILGLFNTKIPELKDQINKFWTAADKGDVEMVKYFMSVRDNWYPTNSVIETGYACAVIKDHTKIMDILSSNYALDPSQIIFFNNPLLHTVIIDNKIKAMEFLLKDERVKNSINLYQKGQTLLYLAVVSKHPQLVSTLLQYKADPNLVGSLENGYTSLGVAIANNSIEIVKILLNVERLDLNLGTTRLKWTSLHVAVASGNIETVKLLLNDKRMNIDLLNSDDIQGRTALVLALEHKNSNKEIINLIKNAHRRLGIVNGAANANPQITPAIEAGITVFRPVDPNTATTLNATNPNPKNRNDTENIDPNVTVVDKKGY